MNKRLINKLRYFLRYYGITRIPAFLAAKFVPFLRNAQWFIEWKESAIDRRFGIQTVGNVEVEDLDYGGESQKHAVEYCPSSGISLGVILEELGIVYSEFTFVDFGCGKGRVLCLAAEFPFASVSGVELSPTLCDLAQQNISRMHESFGKCGDMDCTCEDATLYRLPDTPLVLYFFNPFGSEILSQVMRNVEHSLQNHPRKSIVIYSNPVHCDLFDKSALWEEHELKYGPTPESWAVYRSVRPLKPDSSLMKPVADTTHS